MKTTETPAPVPAPERETPVPTGTQALPDHFATLPAGVGPRALNVPPM